MPDLNKTIPISFEHLKKQYTGHFSNVMGGGDTSTHHLMDDKNFYLGRLRIANNKWVFDNTPKTPELKGLADVSLEIILQHSMND